MNRCLHKVLRNLDKICLNPMGDFSNAELMKNLTYRNATDYYYSNKRLEGVEEVEIEGEKIDLDQFKGDDYQLIRQEIINEIKKNSQEYWIDENDGGGVVIKHKSGIKHWKDGFCWGRQPEQEWAELEQILQKFLLPEPKQNESKIEKKWYKLSDYPGTWIACILTTLFLVIFTFLLIRIKKKKKQQLKIILYPNVSFPAIKK